MKFDFCIGNPPYQDESLGDNSTYTPQVYNKFLDASFEIADKVAMIHPARFLFNAGSTPKIWNEKMLQDEHFKILDYEEDASNVFSNTEIKGGVAISYHDKSSDFGAIGVFTKFEELNVILQKTKSPHSISEITTGAVPYHFSSVLKAERKELLDIIGDSFDLRTNILDKLKDLYDSKVDENNEKYIGTAHKMLIRSIPKDTTQAK